MNEDIHDSIRKTLQNAQDIVIVSHIRPDGDAIGSLLGIGFALIESGKNVQMILADGVPSSFRYLQGSNLVERKIRSDYDLSIVVDCSDIQRTGGVLSDRFVDINIDHHVTNTKFAKFNLVKPEAVATSAILAEYLPDWSFSLSQPIVEALLTGIVSDTLGFRTSNVTAETMRLSADLMQAGADLANLYHQALVRRSFEATQFWGLGLQRMQHENGLIWTSLTLEDRLKVGYPGNDDADLINFMSTIDSGHVAVIFVEQKDEHVKVSWRAEPGYDVSQIALAFGGGGHPAAAGADILGNLETVINNVLQATREFLGVSTITKGNGNLSNY